MTVATLAELARGGQIQDNPQRPVIGARVTSLATQRGWLTMRHRHTVLTILLILVLALVIGLGVTGDGTLLAERVAVHHPVDALANGETPGVVLFRDRLGAPLLEGELAPAFDPVDFPFPAHRAILLPVRRLRG